MDCSYHRAGTCRSCTLLHQPYSQQLRDKQAAAQAAVPHSSWEPPWAGPQSAFRNKAKMVAGGSTASPTLGILDETLTGVDLVDCPLYEPAVATALPLLRDFVSLAALTPYSVSARRGELKHVIVTGSPAGRLMVRFVLRSTEAISRLRKHLPALQERLPQLSVASANIQPAHAAILEGDAEIALTENQILTMTINGIDLRLRPGSFFQTNTTVAAALYRTAVDWTNDLAPESVLDLYCGVGGFALHLAAPGRRVRGVEVSPAAVHAARASAAASGKDAVFEIADATQATDLDVDLVVVNPPRRGLGGLAARLQSSAARAVLYSSCNPATLARDLAAMPGLQPERAQLFDMFAHNRHAELLTLLRRR